MTIEKRGDSNPEKVRLALARLKKVPDVPPSDSLIEMQFEGFQYMKPTPGDDLLFERRRKKRYTEMVKSLPFVNPAIAALLHGAAAAFVAHEIWQKLASDDPTTSEGMRAQDQAMKFLNIYQRTLVTAFDMSVRYAKGLAGLKPIEDEKPPPWVQTDGEAVEEDSE